jgi:TonB family protein
MPVHIALAFLLAAAAVGGPVQPAAGPVRVIFNLASQEADLKQRIEREPNHISNRLELARLYDLVGSRGAAERTLLEAFAIERSPRVYRQLIAHYRRVREYPRAVPIAVEWSEREPSDPEPLVHMSALYLYHPAQNADQRHDFIARGLACADKALSLDPGHIPALEMKRQLLALKWIVADWSGRPAVDAEQEALARIFSVAPSERRVSRYPARRAVTTASGQTPRYVRRGDVREPVLVAFVKPRYPAEAIRAGTHGTVWFEVLIDETGKVAEAWPVMLGRQETPPAQLELLEQAALDAIRQWRFAPTLVNGAPVPVVIDPAVQFVLTLSK